MLSSADLRESQRRLESRGREATERARQKAEKERILAERQAARQAAREEEARQRRLAQLAAAEEVGAGQGGGIATPRDDIISASPGVLVQCPGGAHRSSSAAGRAVPPLW